MALELTPYPQFQITLWFSRIQLINHRTNMYSNFFISWQPNCIFPQYINFPGCNLGNLLLSPLQFGDFSTFHSNSHNRSQNLASHELSSADDQKRPEIQNQSQRIQPQPKRLQIKISKKNRKRAGRRRRKPKYEQKQDRNVVSNLLKIFLKNLLDVQKWDCLITDLISKNIISTSTKRFYDWVLSFRINYKNYMKLKEIKHLLTVQNSHSHQHIFRVVFRHFLHTEGPLHCLTARRIYKYAIKMHIERLRELKLLVA